MESGAEDSGYIEPVERHRRALEDCAGFSAHLAEVAITGFDPDQVPTSRHYGSRPTGTIQRPLVSRRGGRSLPEPSDSELDPEMHWAIGELSDAQRRTNTNGIGLVRAALETATRANAVEDSSEPLEAARRRARLERRNKQKSTI